jgi:hypothetical protein
MIDQLYDLINLTKRIGYYCPIDHISKIFYILYTMNIDKVSAITNNQPLPELIISSDKTRDQEHIMHMKLQIENS